MRRKTCCRQCRVKPSWPLPQHCVLFLEMRHSWTMCTLSRKQKKCHAHCTLPQKPTQNEEYVVLWLPLRCFLVSFTQRKRGPFGRTPTETGHLGISASPISSPSSASSSSGFHEARICCFQTFPQVQKGFSTLGRKSGTA